MLTENQVFSDSLSWSVPSEFCDQLSHCFKLFSLSFSFKTRYCSNSGNIELKFNIWDHGGLLSWRIIYCFKRFFLWHQTSKTIEISPWKWLLSLSKRSVYYVVVQWSQLTDHIVSLLLMTTNPQTWKKICI